MKKIQLLFCCIFINLFLASAQTSERSLAFGFYNTANALQLLSNGHFAVIGRGEPIPGDSNNDTIFAVVFNQQGALLYRKPLTLPVSERHIVRNLIAGPDGGFIVAVGLNLCDVIMTNNVVQRYDSTGALVWSRQSDDNEKLFSRLALSTDGNLFGTDGYTNVLKLNMEDGVTLWKYPLYAPSEDFYYIFDFEVDGAAEHLVSVGYPAFQYWQKTTLNGETKYLLVSATPANSFSAPDKIFGAYDDYYYTFIDSTLYRFNQSEVEELAKLPFPIVDATLSGLNIHLLCKQGDVCRLLKTNLLGQVISDVAPPINAWISASKLSVHNGTYAVAGINGSGAMAGAAPWLEFNAAHLWYRTFTDPATLPPESNNAALTGVMQSEPLTVTPISLSGGQITRYKLEGGGFSIQVTNSGQTLLDKVDVLIGFEWTDVQICMRRPARRVLYSGLNLTPGASVWLDFGDIVANLQPAEPAEFCFWTSAPNESPDGNHEDDVYCHALLVGAEEPKQQLPVGISPNPAAEALTVELPEGSAAGNWQVFNTTGELVAKGTNPAGERIFKVTTAHLPNGLYLLKVGFGTVKFVVSH